MFLVVILILSILFVIFFKPKNKREHFFDDYVSVNVSWSPVTAPSGGSISYTWYACASNFTGGCSNPDPSKWGVTGNKTTSTSVVLTSANCQYNGLPCDFAVAGSAGISLYFGIIATDETSGESSSPSISTLNLSSYVRNNSSGPELGITISDEQGNSPPKAGNKILNVDIKTILFDGLFKNFNVTTAVELQRGSTTTPLNNPQSAPITSANTTTSFSLGTLSTFQPGDIIAISALIYNPSLTAQSSIINAFYGTFPSVTVAQSPAPTNVGSINFSLK